MWANSSSIAVDAWNLHLFCLRGSWEKNFFLHKQNKVMYLLKHLLLCDSVENTRVQINNNSLFKSINYSSSKFAGTITYSQKNGNKKLRLFPHIWEVLQCLSVQRWISNEFQAKFLGYLILDRCWVSCIQSLEVSMESPESLTKLPKYYFGYQVKCCHWKKISRSQIFNPNPN